MPGNNSRKSPRRGRQFRTGSCPRPRMRRLWLALALSLAASPAFAIDCGLAKSEPEKAICGDAEARAADQELGKVYDRVRGLMPDGDRAGLRLSQIEWI